VHTHHNLKPERGTRSTFGNNDVPLLDVKTPKVEHFQAFKVAITDYKAGYREANGKSIAFVHGWPTQITTEFSSFFNSIRRETLSILPSYTGWPKKVSHYQIIKKSY